MRYAELGTEGVHANEVEDDQLRSSVQVEPS
jgi:hypothetical protein